MPAKKILPIVLLLTLVLAPVAFAETYGAGVKETETTSIAKIVADPDAFDGKRVRIAGEVLQVCPMEGCWMELQEGEDGDKIRVKVQDGVIVFPASAVGKNAVAEGVVELLPMKREAYVRWLRHLADEQGKEFDEASVGEGPYRLIQVRGEGAEIADEEG
ncbi:MAG: DUF4920 domain-containing protein [Acidobacteriota bacterium]